MDERYGFTAEEWAAAWEKLQALDPVWFASDSPARAAFKNDRREAARLRYVFDQWTDSQP